MKQQDFENRYKQQWQQFENLLAFIHEKKASEEDLAEFTPLYRRMCQFSSLSKERKYSPHLVDYLNDLVLQGHQKLYTKKSSLTLNIIRFVVADFPITMRENQVYFWLAAALLYLPMLVMGLLVYFNAELIFSVMPADQVSSVESMYDPATRVLGREREADTDILMFGFYIKNNIGIGFRTFASGILFGLGSLFFLIYNGVSIGATAGHLTHLGYTETFYPFVVGHSSFELTAIAISGAAGLLLGWALIAPGQLTRLDSLRQAAKIAIKLVYGVILMLIIAAFLEAFWSSNTSIPITVKYSVGAMFWGLIIVYFLYSGRRKDWT
ncbi:MAG: stage II sporulation protein M [Pseudomonadales bacterium]|nr:stage II sporulation protein M [Pseudomonadales bacterium]